ncbi:DNA methyltransferase [Sinorhizobium meliloti]|uniref:DNA methyltransferase n=1 Tax=Rhizobium meliloti TaxID=382 RepID=UPI00068E168D|nr:DNA methyltransferase [Sinorhizobium meliloti]
MSKERIVLETTSERKSALVQTLDLQGDTISDWFEEQIELSVPDVDAGTVISDFASDDLLEDPSAVLNRLKQQDWAFTSDDTRYLTHDLHPYPAKFIPQIPAHLISTLSLPGEVVLDPFGGSATTAVEAVRLGRRAVSSDANPLSEVIGKVKTGFMTPEVRAELDQLQATILSHLTGADFLTEEWVSVAAKRYAAYIPEIPNREKWFHPIVVSELALACYLIDKTTSGLARDAASMALSRIILRVSFQESETRYVSEAYEVKRGATLHGFAESLRTVVRRLEHAAPALQRAEARFIVGDSRTDISKELGEGSVNLIVTSPPYPNATDYHLYHRFRLFWLGFDPRTLGSIEIGSHLRHQRNGTGFDEYREDMKAVLGGCYAVLQPGRYAVFVVGDAIFKSVPFSTSDAISNAAREVGFEVVGTIDRPIHQTKRSFAKPGRRARDEQLVVLRRPETEIETTLVPPAYRMWDYEASLRRLEIEALTGTELNVVDATAPIKLMATPRDLNAFRKLTFSREVIVSGKHPVGQPTWQKVLENGDADSPRRKDPKYATHGIHPYKGKFYPQLAKSLMNIAQLQVGGKLLDPFCGSGTVLLEGLLNGYAAFGCDINPLAAKIARAKTEVFAVDQVVTRQALHALLDRMKRPPVNFSLELSQFDETVAEELKNWFAIPVLQKLNWVLEHIRLFGDQRLVEFGEVVLSSIVREVSHQDPSDLRIRRRKEPLDNAPVIELFAERLAAQLYRLEKYWSVAGRQPSRIIAPIVRDGDCRQLKTYKALGLGESTVDCVVTSPPYATALPYIDTDRLSLMAIMGIDSSERAALESNLTGSREIRKREKAAFEDELMSASAAAKLPPKVVKALRNIHEANRASDAGFRRQNMASLLWRYFIDMRENIFQIHSLLKQDAAAYYVVGDSRTNAGGQWTLIETGANLLEIAEMVGFEARSMLDISVTTENYNHIRNAITKNEVLEFRKTV